MKVKVKCKNCKCEFEARVADRKRGWGRFCSKSCKAIRQENTTHQHREHHQMIRHIEREKDYWGDTPHFSDAHQFSNEEHDCNKD